MSEGITKEQGEKIITLLGEISLRLSELFTQTVHNNDRHMVTLDGVNEQIRGGSRDIVEGLASVRREIGGRR